VLTAMGVSPEHALGSVRLSLSHYSTAAEVDFLLEKLPGMIAKLRGASPRSKEPAVQSARS
jgi:cysteine desulfurase